ncbi:uncharacterized protein LOC131256266 [Magnolia sinica]|uniref:uncharacterized protein LOC131256266 n=1 Tax=Magnolia sinica TaxID=86752 RepID=UPI002659A3AA|nr:uncharacterized protein LOC131256266 [Magnolia sinica]
MFEKGWTQVGLAPPHVHKVLKIHHTPETIQRFQLYQKSVKTRATVGGDDGRLSLDGNEVLRYWSTDFPDTLAHLSVTSREILLSESGRRAHEKLHEDGVEGDSLTRAMFICRVIAGRVARQRIGGALVEVEDGRFDSLLDGQDFLVLDPRAILPCFIVVYDDDIDGDSSPDWSNKLAGPTCSLSCYVHPITN